MKVTAPDGTRWSVRRQWTGKRPRIGRPDDIPDAFGFDADDGVLAVVGAIVLLIVVVLAAWFLIALALELLILLALLVAGLFGRVVLRRPWTIAATDEHSVAHRWRVVGWRASRKHLRAVRAALAAGTALPDAQR